MVETSAADILKQSSNINEFDVLLGRGGATNNHPGNKHFRDQVAAHQEEYLKARKKEKIGIARRIVSIIQSHGGRFLKRTPYDEWQEVQDKRAQEKTSQALREGLDVRNKTVRPSKTLRRKSAAEGRENTVVIPGKVIVTSLQPSAVKSGLCERHAANATIVVPGSDGSPTSFHLHQPNSEDNEISLKMEDETEETKQDTSGSGEKSNNKLEADTQLMAV